MGASQRRKGTQAERDVVNLHKGNGVHAERVPYSGAMKGIRVGNGHDVDVYGRGEDSAPFCAEVKVGQQVPKTIGDWLGENDCLFARRDRGDWVVVLPIRTWMELVRANAKRAT